MNKRKNNNIKIKLFSTKVGNNINPIIVVYIILVSGIIISIGILFLLNYADKR